MKNNLFFLIFTITLLLLTTSCQQPIKKTADGTVPVEATWFYGKHLIPSNATKTGKTQIFQQVPGQINWTILAASVIKPDTLVPVVLYLHGCKGISRQAERFSDLLISENYAVFMPDSFQRPERESCSEQGTLRERVTLRKEELSFALNQIKKLAWVDQDKILLMGFSEGGNTVDNWSKPGFAGHLIMASACTLVGGKPAAPTGVPVLAVVVSQDKYRPGKSCHIKADDGISKSLIIRGTGHSVAQFPETQDAIRVFLKKCCS